MPKKIIINEESMKKILEEEYLNRQDLAAYIKNDKAFEKRVKGIVADSIKVLFRTLWQRDNFFDSEIRNG